MFITHHVGSLPKLAIRSWRRLSETFYGPKKRKGKAFTELHGNYVDSLSTMVVWEFVYYQQQGTSLSVKWIIKILQGLEAWKVFLRCLIYYGIPLGKKVWQTMNLPSFIMAHVLINIIGSFVYKII